jgi:diguanylate cyclase (GGDEF)-like protein
VDTLARIGGEEFALLLPQTTLEEAASLVERLRASVAATRAKIGDGWLDITVSIGVTCSSRGAQDVNGILRRADEALYAAKRQGKNRFVALASGGALAGAALVSGEALDSGEALAPS